MCRYFTFILIMMCCKSLSSFQSIRSPATCCSLPPRASKCTLLRGAETRVKVRARPVICLVSGSWRGEIQIGFSWARLLPSSRDAAHRCPNPRADGCLYPHGLTQRRARGTMKGGTNKHGYVFLYLPALFLWQSVSSWIPQMHTITRVYVDLYIYWLCGQKLEKGILSRFDTGKLTSQREMGSAKRNEEKEKEKRGDRRETNQVSYTDEFVLLQNTTDNKIDG